MLLKQKFSQLISLKTKNTTSAVSNLQIIIYCLSLVSLLSYLVLVNRTNTMGFEIAEMQLKISGLKENHRDLQSRATELQSLPRIKEISNAQLNMVAAESFDYVRARPAAVAVRR
ncbi:MAG: hypothetical protein UV78_C0033G0020 [Parcubacteria group bacterium GW2011_GWA2_43_17]|nr:MAG: hypothetical protein UV78_C0033G0020 [Parcubacteria group bacterium GW2011_GWA2_43_17]KKT93057.1 MAG: hypothetical protein UW91_C0013G0020 [Parcubacteria group bacterium GW2011_GWF2_45_11]KKT96992.1 MAG: hypothetical protein UW98_C0027G0003 [Parcubacteria group bacterium GW2011_GWC2_45_15]OGY93025.1 MAG: hypothetical protein A2260_02465 [Candidatus Komeilibacteria bacterium RIFOXYA2_FULL_45_9]HAH04766.1 hypothetical protein [Candidatus Komeilibacteria bacterium]